MSPLNYRPYDYPFPTVSERLDRSRSQLVVLRDLLYQTELTRLDKSRLSDMECHLHYMLAAVVEDLEILACHIPHKVGSRVAAHPRSDDYKSAMKGWWRYE